MYEAPVDQQSTDELNARLKLTRDVLTMNEAATRGAGADGRIAANSVKLRELIAGYEAELMRREG